MKLRVTLVLCGWVASSTLAACGPPPAKNTAKRVGKDGNIGAGTPTSLSGVPFAESAPGQDPKLVGCADGQREGFADVRTYADIAGCLGRWEASMSLRKAPTGGICGDDTDRACKSPADICAEGWHVCGRTGDPRDLSERVGASQCRDAAGPGKFVAAISHVAKKKECPAPPTPATRYPCLESGWGAEPVCCGHDCSTGHCKDGVWPGDTRISVGKAQGCGAATSDRNGGILCCKDVEVPSPSAPKPAAPTADETETETGSSAA